MTTDELRRALDEAWGSDREHVERLMLVTAILQTALRDAGMVPTLVGGGAIEVYLSGSYRTSDIDMVVERRTRDDINRVFTALGLHRSGRHWVRGDLYVEVPANYLWEGVEEFPIGLMTLRVIRREHLLGERLAGYRHWKYWRSGMEAIQMMKGLRGTIDEELLRAHLRSEGSEDAYELLKNLLDSDEPISEASLEALWYRHFR